VLACAGTILVTNFDDGTNQGWTVYTPQIPTVGGTGPINMPSGGVGNSPYLETEDTANGRLFFVAPASWSGSFLGGYIQFYLRNQNPNTYVNVGYFGEPVLLITGGGPDLYYYNAPGANLDWTFNYIALRPGPNWSLDPWEWGTPPTDAQVIATLSTISGIDITADWVSRYAGHPLGDYGPDITGLDSVVLSDIPEPATTLLFGLGLAALVLLRSRKRV